MSLTLCICTYGQPLMLARQLETIAAYAEDVRRQLRVVVIDDCGTPPADVSKFTEAVNIELYRINEDKAWNQPGARNLAAHLSEGWLALLDVDMVFDEANIRHLLAMKPTMKRGEVMRYALKHRNTGKLDSSSPNTYVIHKDDFFLAGGYNEDYAGRKGWSDVELLDVLKAHFRVQRTVIVHADFYSDGEIADAAVRTLDRSVKKNKELRIKNLMLAKKLRGWRSWVRQAKGSNLRFTWKKVFP